MKVIFLDIDGVLNCKTTANPRNFPYHSDPELVKRLHRLLDLTDAKVVLSSTWRYDPAGVFSAKNQGIPFIDTTPDMPDRPRFKEIKSWIDRHPDVERYIVIDDEDDDLDSLPLFQPSRNTGLTDEMVEAAAAFLNGKTDEIMRQPKLVRMFQNMSAIFRGHAG